MFGLSEQVLRYLTDIKKVEDTSIPQWIDKNYIADCIIPALADDNDVHCNIAVVAPVSAGKSTLFNALCGYPILPVASKTTSSVPTYINVIKDKSQEKITVYGIKKEVTTENGLSATKFIKDTATARSYSVDNISEEMFNDLFDYMYFVTHGVKLDENKHEYITTVENVAYFMKSIRETDILFNGNDYKKWTISKDDYALSYENPRHRLLLLLILLCVYVNQNDSESKVNEYIKQVNTQRKKLLKKYKFPTNGDYCVYLDWCTEDIPANVTLIDLPGTGSSTQDTKTQSSHTALVRGILSEADAVWVLCSDNGTVDDDLLSALKDTIECNTRKNKVCIYNCKNNRPNDSSPVIDFLKKLPCLTGERCYVVDALAGEYKYIQNDVNALMTKYGSDKRKVAEEDGDEEPTENEITRKLQNMYKGEKKAYCTFTTSMESTNNDDDNTNKKIIVFQDSTVRYTLDTFFKNALTDYIERLKYEIALAKTIEQAKFFVYIRDSLSSSLGILESIGGKGKEISKAVNDALADAKKQSLNAYIQEIAKCQKEMSDELETLGYNIGKKINSEFNFALRELIANIKDEWRTLEIEGHENCLKANRFKNYPLKDKHENLKKFLSVRDSTKNKVNISSFNKALKVADTEVQKFNTLLKDYTNSLKKVTYDFKCNYINAFSYSFKNKYKDLCNNTDNKLTEEFRENFLKTGEKLKKSLEVKIHAMFVNVCDSFDTLTEPNGIFDTLCKETEKTFRERFCENILDKIRDFMKDKFEGTHYIGWLRNCLKPKDLNKILNDDFSKKSKEYAEKLSILIDSIYGINAGDANFPSDLTARVNKFNADKILYGANPEIENMHKNISNLVNTGANEIVDVTKQIKAINNAIKTWEDVGEQYKNIDAVIKDSDVANTKALYNDCKKQINAVISENKN